MIPDMFRNTDLSPQAVSPGSTERRLFYVTNRRNMLEILTSGIIGPRSIYDQDKHLDDLQVFCPEHLPLTSEPVSADVLRLVSPTDDMGRFPVLFELDPTQLHMPRVPAFRKTGRTLKKHLVGSSGAFWWAAPGMIPLTAVRQIHVQKAEHQLHHDARKGTYGNVSDDRPLCVSPDLFAQDRGEAGVLMSWLSGVASPSKRAGDFAFIDRVSGGMLGAIAVASAGYTRPESSVFETVRRLLELFHKAAFKHPAGLDGMARQLEAAFSPDSPSRKADALLLRCVMEYLVNNTPNSWTSTSGMEGIESKLEGATIPDVTRGKLIEKLRGVRRVLRNEVTFPGFSMERKTADMRIPRSLLLFGLRPTLQRLVGWDQIDLHALHATSHDRMLAGFMAGCLTGRQQLPVTFRSNSIDRYIMEMIPTLVYGNKKSVLRPHVNWRNPELVPREPVADVEADVIKSGGETLYEDNPITRLRWVLASDVTETLPGQWVWSHVATKLGRDASSAGHPEGAGLHQKSPSNDPGGSLSEVDMETVLTRLARGDGALSRAEAQELLDFLARCREARLGDTTMFPKLGSRLLDWS